MKALQTLLLALFFISCFVIGTKAENLKETSKNFTELMTQTQLSQAEFTAQLKEFIDPAANVDSICSTYYNHWKKCTAESFFPLKTVIEDVQKSNKSTATVYISNIWHCDTGDQFYLLSQTEWVKKKNKWYRSNKESQIVQNARLDMAYKE